MANFDPVPVLRFTSLTLESIGKPSRLYTTNRDLHYVKRPLWNLRC